MISFKSNYKSDYNKIRLYNEEKEENNTTMNKYGRAAYPTNSDRNRNTNLRFTKIVGTK